MRKRSGIVIEGVSEEAKLVDAAQIEVLRYAKYAAEQMLTDTAYLKGVERIVELLIGKLTNDELKARCRALFPSYAVKLLLRERALVRTYALWYGYALAARSLNKRGGRAAFERANKAISPTLRKTPLFKAVITSIPDKAYNWAVPLEQWERSYTKTINRIMVDLVYSDAKEDYTTNVNLRNIAEMTVRYERQLERLEELKADGIKLVWIEPHANCSERCEKYQGKLYSLDGSTGKIDGIDYRPLEYATNNPVDRYVTRAGKVYQNGCITGFNCRHQLIPYEEGNRPMPIPADVIARRRAIEQRQREMERDIRAQKRKAVLMRNVSPEAYNKAREKASRMTELYEEYSRKNDAAFSRERTSIFTDALGKVLYENLAEQYIPH
jgi:hypothetical protein